MRCNCCGKDLTLVGLAHNCVANIANMLPQRYPEVANTVANTVANIDISIANSDGPTDTQSVYPRYKDKDARRSYMRTYMQKRRVELRGRGEGK